jgi:hypothetical protein
MYIYTYINIHKYIHTHITPTRTHTHTQVADVGLACFLLDANANIVMDRRLIQLQGTTNPSQLSYNPAIYEFHKAEPMLTQHLFTYKIFTAEKLEVGLFALYVFPRLPYTNSTTVKQHLFAYRIVNAEKLEVGMFTMCVFHALSRYAMLMQHLFAYNIIFTAEKWMLVCLDSA